MSHYDIIIEKGAIMGRHFSQEQRNKIIDLHINKIIRQDDSQMNLTLVEQQFKIGYVNIEKNLI